MKRLAFIFIILSASVFASDPSYEAVCKACGPVLSGAIAPKFYDVKTYDWNKVVKALREQQDCIVTMQSGFPLSPNELEIFIAMDNRIPGPVIDYKQYSKSGDVNIRRLGEALGNVCSSEKRHSLIAQIGITEGPASCYESAENIKSSLEKQLPASRYSFGSVPGVNNEPGDLRARYVFEVVNRYDKVEGWIDLSAVKFAFNHYVTRVLDRLTGKTYIVDGYLGDVVQLEEEYAKNYFVFDKVKECIYNEYHKLKHGSAPGDRALNLNPTFTQDDLNQVESIYNFCMEI